MKLSLSENISSLRRASGLTQERLAEALGVSFAAVSKWERGGSLGSVKSFSQIGLQTLW